MIGGHEPKAYVAHHYRPIK